MPALLLAALAAAPGCRNDPEMLRIEGGPFWMGSHAGERVLAMRLSSPRVREAGWFAAEVPRRQIVLPAFCIDRLLVTRARYARFVAAAGHRPPGISRKQYVEQGFLVHDYDGEVTPYLWREAEPPASLADHPVVLVDVRDAEAYCRWRDPALRLPSEAEWEKAARGPDGRILPWGNAWDPTRLNSAERGPGGTTPVTPYPAGASPYGLLDAVGNVFQWTATSLPDGRRLLKGCAWDDEAGLCRPAFRHGRPAWSRHILIGFRCAGSADDPPARGPTR
jgi:formylglycine-generating enzyme required for sulfatase activity